MTANPRRILAAALVAGLAAASLLASGCKKKGGKPSGARKVTTDPLLNLPRSASNTNSVEGPEVRVRRNAITVGSKAVASLRYGKVDAKTKRDGPDGFFINPLFKALKEKVGRLLAEERQGGTRFNGMLRLSVDTSTSYRLLAEVLYTAKHAGFRHYVLITQGPGGGESGVLIETPKLSVVTTRSPSKKQKLSLGLKITMTDNGFYLKSRFGSECPEGVGKNARLCFPAAQGKYTPAVLKKLQHHLWYLFAEKYRDSFFYATPHDRWAVQLIPEPTVRYGDIVRALDAMREIPRDATQPKPRHRIPDYGCMMKFQRASQSYGFTITQGNSVRDVACMYYLVTLALGSD